MVRADFYSRLARFRSIGTVAVAAVIAGGVSMGLGSRAVQAQANGQFFLSVLDKSGAPITDLKVDDVSVKEGENEGKILKLDPINWPMKLTVLVDNGSRSAEYLPSVKTGLKGLLDALPAGIEVQAYSLAPQPRALLKPTPEKDKIQSGFGLLSPDVAGAKFFEGLTESGNRIDKEKGQYFPVILMITSDVGDGEVSDRDYQKLQKQVTERAITVHYIMLTTPGGGGSAQTAIGTGLTMMSGGRFEKINSSSRLATLLPELGEQIAKANDRQSHQYRVTYQPPATRGPGIAVGISDARMPGTVKATLDGRLP